eukprot:g3353.t1
MVVLANATRNLLSHDDALVSRTLARLHSYLGHVPPAAFLKKFEEAVSAGLVPCLLGLFCRRGKDHTSLAASSEGPHYRIAASCIVMLVKFSGKPATALQALRKIDRGPVFLLVDLLAVSEGEMLAAAVSSLAVLSKDPGMAGRWYQDDDREALRLAADVAFAKPAPDGTAANSRTEGAARILSNLAGEEQTLRVLRALDSKDLLTRLQVALRFRVHYLATGGGNNSADSGGGGSSDGGGSGGGDSATTNVDVATECLFSLYTILLETEVCPAALEDPGFDPGFFLGLCLPGVVPPSHAWVVPAAANCMATLSFDVRAATLIADDPRLWQALARLFKATSTDSVVGQHALIEPVLIATSNVVGHSPDGARHAFLDHRKLLPLALVLCTAESRATREGHVVTELVVRLLGSLSGRSADWERFLDCNYDLAMEEMARFERLIGQVLPALGKLVDHSDGHVRAAAAAAVARLGLDGEVGTRLSQAASQHSEHKERGSGEEGKDGGSGGSNAISNATASTTKARALHRRGARVERNFLREHAKKGGVK